MQTLMTNDESKLNIKKYRADTTRGALEMIKQDLGDNALVLETKQVRTGGFLGLRSTTQIEVSAASPAMFADKKCEAGSISQEKIAFTDYAHAGTKTLDASIDFEKRNLIAALSERAARSNDFEKQFLAHSLKADQPAIETVEISTDEPRIIYPKKSLPTVGGAAAAAAPDASVSTASNRELELLRADLREVKFSLGALANRQTAHSWQSEVDLELFGEIFDQPFYDVYVMLTETGFSTEMARQFLANIIPLHKKDPIAADQLEQTTLNLMIPEIIKFEQDPLLRNKPSILAMIGATGVGKTTTVAKLAANISLFEGRRVELVTVDTYRIAAVEQLKTYAEIIGAGCHVVNSVLGLDEVLRRLSPNATVLIDTTGRNPHDLADQHEFSDYLQSHAEIRKCLVVQATTHPDDAAAAIKKYQMYAADCIAITKMDETLRPGSLIQTIAESNLPLAYVCAGQRVPEDLQVATARVLTDQILGRKK